MDYIYKFEEEADKSKTAKELEEININVLNILCYNINSSGKYPYIQFLLEKIPFCSNLIEEEFTLPIIFIQNDNIKEETLNKVSEFLSSMGCNGDFLCEDMYKGIVFLDKHAFVLINISGIDINYQFLSRNSLYWFGLPTEIINTQTICNIGISDELSYVFRNNPEIGIIHKLSNKNDFYNLPDVVYYGNEFKKVEFNGIFINPKEKIYESCKEYYFFYKSFNDAVKSGGWSNVLDQSPLVENDFGRFINGGINRVVVFTDNFSYHIESNTSFSLNDDYINNLLDDVCISICFTDRNIVSPDLLVKSYNNLFPLSYHKIDKKTLDESFKKKNSSKYMIL